MKEELNMLKKMHINGEWVSANNNETFSVYNPATGEVVGEMPNGGADETNDAVAAAQAAFSRWAELTAEERSDYLIKWRDIIAKNEDKIAELICL